MIRLFLAAALLAGCAGSGNLEPALDEPFALEVGQAAVLEGVEIRFVEVVEDSRCPDGANCVWAGKARVRVAVGGTPMVLSVPHSPADGPEPSTAIIGALEVAVHALTPPPAVEASSEPVRLALIALEAE